MKSIKLLPGLTIVFIGLGINWLGNKLDDLSDYILTKSTSYWHKIDSKKETWYDQIKNLLTIYGRHDII